MPLYSTACPLPINRKIFRHIASGGAAITTSRAFNSGGGQVGTTNTGDIPESWLQAESTVTSVIFANDNSVLTIGSYAFYQCSSLTSITIPNSVLTIDASTFFECTTLTTATIGNSVTSIGNYAFQSSALTSITIPNSVISLGAYVFTNCSSLTTATIGNSVTSIGSYAFYQCSALTSVTFTPTSSVTSIGYYGFGSCAFSSFTIPNSVTNIGSSAFYSCGSLTSITIPSNVTSIGAKAFKSCLNLATVSCYVAQSVFTGSDAFYDTASPLVIQARITDTSWTAGVGLTFQGNTNVTVIKNL